jgi:hypothetical protein
MRKIYFIMLALFCTATISHAQQVELVGTGMYQTTQESIPVLDDTNLESVTLFAVYLRSGGPSPVNTVVLEDNSESYTVSFTEIPASLNYGDLPEAGLGYFTKVFDDDVDADGEKIDATGVNTNFLYAFYGFIERNDPNADYYSVFDYTHIHCWANGEADPHTYELDLQANGLNRKVTVKMPFSGLQNNSDNLDREAKVEISGAGMTAVTYTFTGNNVGDYYHEFTSPEFDVPAATTKIFVKVWSPDTPKADDDPRPSGDSFTCGGVVADVKDIDRTCTYTIGYWKTHSEYGPATPADPTWDLLSDGPDTDFYLSGDSWYDVFWTAPKGNKYYSLAHQFMGVHLNFLNGADPTAIQADYDAAKLLFETYTPAEVKDDKDLKDEFGSYIDALTDYNEGTTGPGHCDDGEEEEEEDDKSSLVSSGEQEFLVYPNPMTTNGTIDLTILESGQTTVEVYNMMGAKVATLFDRNVEAGQKHQVRFNVSDYTKGLYIIYVRNGNSIQKQKITVVK